MSTYASVKRLNPELVIKSCLMSGYIRF